MNEDTTQTPPNPVDGVINALITNATSNGRSWVLDAVKDNEGRLNIGFKHELPPTDEWKPPAGTRHHTFGDTTSLALYLKRYGGKGAAADGGITVPDSVIFYDEKGVTAILRETIVDGVREVLTCPFTYAQDFLRWQAILGKAIPHMALRDALVPLSHTVRSSDLLLSLGSIKYAEQTKFDTEIKEVDGEASYGVVFTVQGAGDSLKKIPRKVSIAVPILDEDILTGEVATVECDVSLQMPKEPGQPLGIIIQCQALDVMRRQRLRQAMDTLRLSLGDGEDWLIVAGKPTYQKVDVGRTGRFDGYKTNIE